MQFQLTLSKDSFDSVSKYILLDCNGDYDRKFFVNMIMLISWNSVVGGQIVWDSGPIEMPNLFGFKNKLY